MKFRYDKEDEKLIVSESTRIEYHQIKIWLTRKIKGWKFQPAVKAGLWNGEVSHFENGKINMGLWKECFKACKEINTTFNIENKEEFPLNRNVSLDDLKSFCQNFFKYHKIKDKDGNWNDYMPYDYQIETAYKILKNRYCLGEVATSGGKSLIISIIIFYILKKENPDAKFLIIVPSLSLVTQFYNNLVENNWGFNYIDKLDINSCKLNVEVPEDYSPCNIRMEEIMSETPRISSGNPNIYIGTYQSLVKRDKKFFEQFHTIACDEAHQAKSASLKSILKKTFKTAYNRFGVSGTFPSSDTLEILEVQSVLGPIITEISASELVKSGTITPMTIKATILNHNQKDINDRLSYIRKQGGGSNAFKFEKEFIHQSEKRLDFIKKIVEKCDKNVLLLFHTIEYGKKIFEKLKSELPDKEFFYIDGEVSGKKREIIKQEMEKVDDKVKVAIASFGTIGTGWSIKNLHYLIMVDSFKSDVIILQAIGRILRLFVGKERAVIFDIVDVFSDEMNNILYNHYRERLKIYTNKKYPLKEIKIKL